MSPGIAAARRSWLVGIDVGSTTIKGVAVD
jgi:activator of 2-hydroxyglutaryl-CoA dehydratase